MADLKAVIRELAKHALAKKGAKQDRSYANSDEQPQVHLRGASEHYSFFCVYKDDNFARLPMQKSVFNRYRKRFPVLRRHDNWTNEERDAHIWVEAPFNGDLRVEFLKTLIDEAYTIVWNKFDSVDRALVEFMIEFESKPYDENILLDGLIEAHNLLRQGKAIRRAARQAVLLRTHESSEGDTPLGATKLGGRPDLPFDADWPIFWNYPQAREMDRPGPEKWPEDYDWPPSYLCKPLAFLMQINLAEIAKCGTPIKGLPRTGLLSLFSILGWMSEETDTVDQAMQDLLITDGDQDAYTAVLYTPAKKTLRRLKPRANVYSFKAAKVERRRFSRFATFIIPTTGASQNRCSI